MAGVALAMWLFTIAGGVVLALIWLANGGAKVPSDSPPDTLAGGASRSARSTVRERSHIALSAIVPHAGLAVVGAVVIGAFAANRDDPDFSPAPWVALVILLATVALGLSMFTPWLRDRLNRSERAGRERPEDRFPDVVVVLHGAAALVTLVLVLLVALG